MAENQTTADNDLDDIQKILSDYHATMGANALKGLPDPAVFMLGFIEGVLAKSKRYIDRDRDGA